MDNKNKVRIAKIHICSFERVGSTGFKLNTKKYPERVCVIDENKGIAIDVKTEHQYPYVGVTSTLHFINQIYINEIKEGQRVACFEYYMILSVLELDSNMLDKCEKVMKKLQNGFNFKNGNSVMTNEQYLEMINKEKEQSKVKKILKKGK